MPGRKPPRRGETGNGFMAPPRRGVERRRRTSPSSTTAASVVRSLAACARAWASNSSRMSTVAFTINHRTTHFAEAHAVAQGVFSIPTSATTKFVDEQGEGASPAGACVSRPAASAAAATPTAHAAGIAARVPTRIRLRARPPRGGSPGVCPRTRGSCPTIPVARCRGSPRPAVNPATLHTATITPEVSGTVTVDIAAGAAQDSSGNPSAAADQFSITANTAAPTVTITSSASEPVTGAFSIAVTFSEPVNGFELADLVVGNGNASGLQGRRRGRSPDRGRPGRQPWPPQPRAPIIRVHAPHGLHSRRHSSHLRRSLPVSARRSFQAHQFNRTQ